MKLVYTEFNSCDNLGLLIPRCLKHSLFLGQDDFLDYNKRTFLFYYSWVASVAVSGVMSGLLYFIPTMAFASYLSS